MGNDYSTLMGGSGEAISEAQAKPKTDFLDYSKVDGKVEENEPTSFTENQQEQQEKHFLDYSPEGVDGKENESTSLTENQQLAEFGEFDKLLSSVNRNLAEMGLEEDSKEMIGALTEIAGAGSPEYRVWAGKMLNWHNDMANFLKGVQ